jgi:hypothetical protein
MLKVKVVVIASSILAAATVLWIRQTPDALLRVESLGGAITQVAFWSAPTFVLYALLARSRVAVFGEGLVLAAILVAGWWSHATDWHSTASLVLPVQAGSSGQQLSSESDSWGSSRQPRPTGTMTRAAAPSHWP